MNIRPKLLGIAASLRNARWGIGNQELVDSLKSISSEDKLVEFLSYQSELHLENFLKSGRAEGNSFLETYKNLKNNNGDKGLSNSEVTLAAALWAALQNNVDIDHLSLSEYFLASGLTRNLDSLKEKLIAADGLLISGPVYFGDRGSLTHSLIDLIRHDSELRTQLQGKVYAGIAVGAKRNGGQETTLIYQMWDMINLGLLAVGNDSDTTSQYGGTGHAGDVGTMHKDSYGLQTAIGTGRRIASLIRKFSYRQEIKDKVRILFLVLQDRKNEVQAKIDELVKSFKGDVQATIINITEKNILRCLACDFCPTHIDVDEVYRCIINSGKDDLKSLHEALLHHDVIVPVVLSLNDTSEIVNNYQTFIERTRYLRRGDYVFSNQLVAPLTFEEIGVRENYSIRIMTSMLRHHTVMSKPIIGHIYEGGLLNKAQIQDDFRELIASAKRLTAARLAEASQRESSKYNPIGYILSSAQDAENEELNLRKIMKEARYIRLQDQAKTRLQDPYKARLILSASDEVTSEFTESTPQ
jgi:multimeric flavodoxin WrbA